MIKCSVNFVTKNRADLLRNALKSVLRQNGTDFELVIVNDASNDYTKNVVEEFKSKFNSLTYISNEHSKGVSYARQQALENSKGEYIAILDDDDIWIDPNKLKAQAEFLDANKEVGIVGTCVEIYKLGSGEITLWEPPKADSDLRSAMLYKTPFLNTATMFRRELALQVGGFSKELKFAEDYTLWLEMGLRSKFANLNIFGTRVSQHDSGLTHSNSSKMIWNVIEAAVKYRKKYPNWLKALFKLIPQYIIVSIFGIYTWKKIKSIIYDSNSSKN